MNMEKEVKYTLRSTRGTKVLSVIVKDGEVEIDDWLDNVPPDEFCRLIRGLANAIEADNPPTHLATPLPEPVAVACPNYTPVM